MGSTYEMWRPRKEITTEALKPCLPTGRDITKEDVRQLVWNFMEAQDIAQFPRPVFHRIPNFRGAAEAGQKMTALEVFQKAQTVQVSPDKPQESVRFHVLERNKKLLVSTPRLRSGLLNQITPPPGSNKETLKLYSSRQGIDNHSTPLHLEAKIKVDLMVCGSVAVSREGYRVGKGEGYTDIEYGIMVSLGILTQDTVIVTTVHDCQVFDTLPAHLFEEHDLKVDIIVTPSEVIMVNSHLHKPQGIYWSALTQRKLNEMPVLKAFRQKEQREGKKVTLKDERESFPGKKSEAQSHGSGSNSDFPNSRGRREDGYRQHRGFEKEPWDVRKSNTSQPCVEPQGGGAGI